MVKTLIPWATTCMGATILYLSGRGAHTRHIAWWLGVANQALWISYAFVAEAYGFIVGSLLYGGVYIRHILKGE